MDRDIAGVCMILFGIVAFCIGSEVVDRKWRKEIAKRGYAEYVTLEDGESEWRWKENTTEGDQ